MEMIKLDKKRDTLAVNLTYAEQRALEIGVTIAGGANVVLLDEPTAGMGVDDIPLMTSLIADLGKDYGVMLIEHNMNIVMSISDVVTVMSRGSVLVEGKPELVRADKRVREAYLGEAA